MTSPAALPNPYLDIVVNRVLSGVLEESSLDAQELDLLTGAAGHIGAAYQRFGNGDTAWVVKEFVPGRQDLVVFAIFAGDIDNGDDNNAGDVRIYAIPAMNQAPFVRYTMSRLHPTLLGLVLDEKRFVSELAEEWDTLGVRFGVTDGTDDSVICPDCGTETETRAGEESEDEEDPEPMYCGKCGKQLPVEAEVVQT